jgi:hypothetical protein
MNEAGSLMKQVFSQHGRPVAKPARPMARYANISVFIHRENNQFLKK